MPYDRDSEDVHKVVHMIHGPKIQVRTLRRLCEDVANVLNAYTSVMAAKAGRAGRRRVGPRDESGKFTKETVADKAPRNSRYT